VINKPLRYEKNAVIAKSGVYSYGRPELSNMEGLGPIPSKHDNLSMFNVYRPSTVLAESASKFARLPVIKNHTAMVDPGNYRDISLGWTGDSVSIVSLPGSKEIGLDTSVNLLDEEGLAIYESGNRQVSPYYSATWNWEDGVSPDGKDYQIVMDSIKWANHLALTPNGGRGGSEVMVYDSAPEVKKLKWKTGLRLLIKRLTSGMGDSGAGLFRQSIMEYAAQAGGLDDAQTSDAIDMLRAILDDVPDGDGKAIVDRLLDDLPRMKDLGQENAQKIAELISQKYEEAEASAIKELEVAPVAVPEEKEPGKPGEKAEAFAGKETPAEEKAEVAEVGPEAHAEMEASGTGPDAKEPVSEVPAEPEEKLTGDAEMISAFKDLLAHRASGKPFEDWYKAGMPKAEEGTGAIGEPAPEGASVAAKPVEDVEEKKPDSAVGAVGDSVFNMKLDTGKVVVSDAKSFFGGLPRAKGAK
jgi:hypothetical protein